MATKKETKKKVKVRDGKIAVHIQATNNNTIVSVTDKNGNVIKQSSSGAEGNRGAKKSTPFVAQQVVEAAMKDVVNNGATEVEIYIKGAGGGREAAIRAVGSTGLKVTMIKDVSPIPHNGCRPPKARRL